MNVSSDPRIQTAMQSAMQYTLQVMRIEELQRIYERADLRRRQWEAKLKS